MAISYIQRAMESENTVFKTIILAKAFTCYEYFPFVLGPIDYGLINIIR